MRRIKKRNSQSKSKSKQISQNWLELKLQPALQNLTPSFLDLETISTHTNFSFLLDKTYDLWCVDREIGFTLNTQYSDYKIYCEEELETSPVKKIGTSNPEPILYKEKIFMVSALL